MGTTPEGKDNRLAAVDVAKLLAVSAVVWIHATASDASRATLAWCRFAVPFFTCAAVYFVLRKASSSELSLTAYSRQRARRIYVPFLLWGMVYFFARSASHAFTGTGSPIQMTPALLLNGPAHHLWFLPFICAASILVYALARIFGQPDPKRTVWWGAASLALGLAVALIPCPVLLDTEGAPSSYFVDHAWEIMPAIFFGAAIFWLAPFDNSRAWRWALLGVAVVAVATDFIQDTHSTVVPHLAGASLFFFTLRHPPRPWMNTLRPWAELAFVIYLVHVLFIEALQTIRERYGVSSLEADLSVWALALVASAIFGRWLAQRRFSRWVVPG